MQEEIKLPAVSVIIATYNYGHWLPAAIESAVKQDYPNKQIVVVDDCSTDDTEGILNKTYVQELLPSCIQSDEEKDIFQNNIAGVPFLYIKLKKNGGPSRARNIAIKTVEEMTDLFAVLDADDMWMQGKLSKSVKKFLEYPDKLAAVYSDYLILNPHGVLTYESKEPYDMFRLLQECIVHSGSVVSKLALSKVGLYDEELRTCEDFDLWLRCSDHFTLNHIPEPLVIVRVTGQNSTDTVQKERWENDYKRVQYKTYLRQNGII